MLRMSFIVLLALSSGRCQYPSQQQVAPSTGGRDTSGWDIRLAVPGEPDRDYPTLNSIPKTGFTCAGKDAGYYADVETRCQVFRVCTIGATYGFQSFLCPNGTLFNQQVFVCDWWMNVNCQGSQRYYNNNDKFGNLKLGPSMMSDIKKMLTYPMSNPYNNNNLNNNQFVMQIYNPPPGQPFSSVGNIADTFRNTGFRPAQQLQLPAFQNNINRYNENIFSGSTPSPLYAAANFEQNANFINAHRLAQLQNEQFQNTQNGKYLSAHGHEAGSAFSENNAKFGQSRNQNENAYLQTFTGQNFNTQNAEHTDGQNSQLSFAQNMKSQYNNVANAQYQNGFTNSQRYQFSNSQNIANKLQNSQYNQNTYQNEKQIQYANNFNGQYPENAKQTAKNGDGQNELEVTVTKQQYTYPSHHDKQYTYKISADKANSLQVGHLQEVRQNLVSENAFNTNPLATDLTSPIYSTPTVVSKALDINHIKAGKSLTPNAPSSRITYKTWVVQPSKSGQIVSKPTPYTYERPKSARQFLPPPTISSKVYLAPTTLRPTVASRLYAAPPRTTSLSRLYLAPVRSTVPAYLNLPVVAASTLKPSRLYLNPSTSRPSVSARVYSSVIPSKAGRLTAPSSSQEPIYNRNTPLHASASTVAPVYTTSLKSDLSNQSFSITKHSLINTNHNNLTFTDILTKEKLDITVNDIVKDTSDILETTESKLGQLQEQPKNYVDVGTSPIYIPSQTPSVENKNVSTTETIDTTSTKSTFQSAKLTQDPSISLELPVVTLRNNQTNQIATLPYFKPKLYASKKNLENFVSFRITVPQNTAQYILQSKNESEFDSLEILTAGRSSYLVLVNKGQTSSKLRRSFIPLGKLVANKKSNFSNPQAFVYDFLANSINAAKTYENTLSENTKKFHLATANVFGQQFQNIDAEDLNEISQKISQLTTAQYNNHNNNYKINQYQTDNLVTNAPTTNNIGNTYRGLTKFLNNQELQNNEQFNQIQSGQLRQSPEINGNFYSSNFYNGNAGNNANFEVKPTDIQNGQLYQSSFINQNAHQQLSANSAYTNKVNQQNLEINELQSNSNADDANVNLSKESNEVELVNTGLQSSGRSAAKLQVAPTATNSQETEIFHTVNQSTAKTSNGNAIVPNENGIGAQFHKQIVGTINNSKSDKNLITYKADKSFYVYTKYVGSEGNKETTKTGNKLFGELRQSQQHSDANVPHSANNGREITTVQFVPSLSFELDDSDQRHLVNVVQNEGENSAAYTANFNHNDGYNLRSGSVPTSSVDYSGHRTMISNDRGLQHYNQVPVNQYTGPSSYSAPQASIGRLEAQNGELNVVPSNPSNGYAPARLEEFEERVTDSGYPKVTPAIPFSF